MGGDLLTSPEILDRNVNMTPEEHNELKTEYKQLKAKDSPTPEEKRRMSEILTSFGCNRLFVNS